MPGFSSSWSLQAIGAILKGPIRPRPATSLAYGEKSCSWRCRVWSGRWESTHIISLGGKLSRLSRSALLPFSLAGADGRRLLLSMAARLAYCLGQNRGTRHLGGHCHDGGLEHL